MDVEDKKIVTALVGVGALLGLLGIAKGLKPAGEITGFEIKSE